MTDNMQTNMFIERIIREIYKFKDDNVFYSFKYSYSETTTDKGKHRYMSQKNGTYAPISCIVIFGGMEDREKSKKLYFTFHPDLKSNNTMGSLVFTPKNGTIERKRTTHHRFQRPQIMEPGNPYENAAIIEQYREDMEREAHEQDEFGNYESNKPLKFDSIEESTLFATILQKVHTECIRIMMKFKDQSTIPHASVQSFFEQ